MSFTRKDILNLFIILLVTTVIYLTSFGFGLTYLDDNVWILDYHWYLKHASNWSSFFTHPDLITGFFYRPLLNLSFMFNALINGQSLVGYRFFNLCVHLINIVLVYVILNKTITDKARAPFLTFIFAVHPALTSSVVWIPGRTDSFLATFILLSFLNLLTYSEQNKKRFLILHGFFFFLALLTKETAIVLFVLCFIYLKWGKRRALKDLWPTVTVWGCVLLSWGILRTLAMRHALPIDSSGAVASVWENAPGFISYLGKICLPVNLSVTPNLKDISLWPGLLSVVGLGIWGWCSKEKRIFLVFFGGLWFVLFIFPSLILSFILHEYRIYVPFLGILFIFGELAWPKSKYVTLSIAVVSIRILILINLVHIQSFKDKFSYWKNSVKTSAHLPLAHRNLGAMYHLENKLELAKPEYEEALRLNPYEFMAHNNLGLIAMDHGDFKLAEHEFLSEIKINPMYDNVYYNLGVLYGRMGRLDEAERAWLKTIELNPKYLGAYPSLIDLYTQRGDTLSAQKYLQRLKSFGVNITQIKQTTQ